ncbi:MAG: hypothetical protein M3Y87_18160 [Myxococcota bacterium]|nr:hypothetical protein [Myxococcota bacterium]
MATTTDREKLAARMAEADRDDLRLIVTRARSGLERSEAARELERRGLEVPDSPLGLEVPEPSPRRAAPVLTEAAAPLDSLARFRIIVVGVKLGAIASVFSVFVLPSSFGTWPIVITGAALGGLIAFSMTRR